MSNNIVKFHVTITLEVDLSYYPGIKAHKAKEIAKEQFEATKPDIYAKIYNQMYEYSKARDAYNKVIKASSEHYKKYNKKV